MIPYIDMPANEVWSLFQRKLFITSMITLYIYIINLIVIYGSIHDYFCCACHLLISSFVKRILLSEKQKCADHGMPCLFILLKLA